jgi:hypothetical protein
MKVPLGNPHRLEPALVGKAGALSEQIEFVPLELRRRAGEEKQAECGPPGHRRPVHATGEGESSKPKEQSSK